MVKYIVMRKRPRKKEFKAFNIAPMTKKEAQKEARLHRQLGAKSKFKIKKISELKLREVSNIPSKDVERLWRRRR